MAKEKYQEIVEALKNGAPKRRIDPENKGNLARRLLKGEKLSTEKINQMHKNLIDYRENPRKYRELNESYNDHLPEIPKTEKIQEILQSVERGVAKSHLDPAGIGDGVRKLQKGKSVGEGKINEMYVNLLALRGEKSERPVAKNVEEKYGKECLAKIDEQQKQIESLKKQLSLLHKQVKELVEANERKEKKKKQIIRVLGVTVVEKTDHIRGKKYKRWYGTFRENGKQRWIYIGVDITKAREKIRNYLEEKRGEQKCKS